MHHPTFWDSQPPQVHKIRYLNPDCMTRHSRIIHSHVLRLQNFWDPLHSCLSTSGTQSCLSTPGTQSCLSISGTQSWLRTFGTHSCPSTLVCIYGTHSCLSTSGIQSCLIICGTQSCLNTSGPIPYLSTPCTQSSLIITGIQPCRSILETLRPKLSEITRTVFMSLWWCPYLNSKILSH